VDVGRTEELSEKLSGFSPALSVAEDWQLKIPITADNEI
jgi:hypothetical protein